VQAVPLDNRRVRGHIRCMTEAQWMSLVASLLLLAFFYPAIRRLPRDTLLRNVAIWLGIFALVGLAYTAFGPF